MPIFQCLEKPGLFWKGLFKFFKIFIVVQDEEIEKATTEGEELSLPDTSPEAESPNVIANGDEASGDKEENTLPKDPITLSWEETK